MENLGSKDLPTVFMIPPFRMRRIVPIVGIVLFAGIAAYIPLKMGAARTTRVFAEYPEMWVLFIILLGGIALFLRMALPRCSSLARLDIWHDRLRLTPGRMRQRIMGDAPVEERIPAQSKEVVLRHSSGLGLRFGYSIVIRDASGAERILTNNCLNSLNQQASLRLAETISAVTGLPVRLAVRLRADDGSIQEVSWEAAPPKEKAQIIVVLLGGMIPILTGCFVGFYALPPAKAIVIGLTAWGGWIIACAFVARTSAATNQFSLMYLLTTIVTFSALYSISAVFVGFLLRTP